MSTENPNPFAQPAGNAAPSLFSQFNQSGAMVTPGSAAIANYRARGGIPVGGPAAMPNAQPATMLSVQGGQMDQPSVMPVQAPNMAPPQAGPVVAPNTMPAPIRPPSAGFLQTRSPLNPAASISSRAGAQPAISRY